MGVETSPTFTFGGGGGTAPDPNADLMLSPLWPLQAQLRAGFIAATNSAGITPEQISRTWLIRTQIEDMFGQWRNIASLTALRASINTTIADLDTANDSSLAGFQTQLLALSHWSDALAS